MDMEPACQVKVEGGMTGVYLWGWGSGGRGVAFWGWAVQSYAEFTGEPESFIRAIVIDAVLTAGPVVSLGASVSVKDSLAARASTGEIRFKSVPESVTAKSAAREMSVKSVKWTGVYISGLSAQASRSVNGGVFASKVETAGTVGKSSRRNEKRKIVKK